MRNCKFQDPPTPTQRGDNFGVKRLKLIYFLIDFLLYCRAKIRQIKCLVMMSKEEYAKFHGNFMKLMYNFDDVYQYTVHIDCEGVVMQFSSAIIEFYLFYDRPVDMQIQAPLTRSQCRVCYSGDR